MSSGCADRQKSIICRAALLSTNAAQSWPGFELDDVEMAATRCYECLAPSPNQGTCDRLLLVANQYDVASFDEPGANCRL